MVSSSTRSLAKRLIQIRHVTKARQSLVIELRRDSVLAAVRLMKSRHTRYQKRDDYEEMTFVEWLIAEQHMEDTYLHHGTGRHGMSLGVRRRWAIQFRDFFMRPELQLEMQEDEFPGEWAALALEAQINARFAADGEAITVLHEGRGALPTQGLFEPGVAFYFEDGQLPEEGQESWAKTLEKVIEGRWRN